MTFVREDLEERIARYRVDVERLFRGSRALQRRSVEDVVARQIAGYAEGLHGRGDAIERDITPQGSSDSAAESWAAMLAISGDAIPGVACARPTSPMDAADLVGIDTLTTSDGAVWSVTAVSSAGDLWIEWVSGPTRRLEGGEVLQWAGGPWTDSLNQPQLDATVWDRGSTRTIPALDTGGLRRAATGWHASLRYGRLEGWEAWASTWAGVHSVHAYDAGGLQIAIATLAFDGGSPTAPTASELAKARETIDAMAPIGSAPTPAAAILVPATITLELTDEGLLSVEAAQAAVELEVEALIASLGVGVDLLAPAMERVALDVGLEVNLLSGDETVGPDEAVDYVGVTWA